MPVVDIWAVPAASGAFIVAPVTVVFTVKVSPALIFMSPLKAIMLVPPIVGEAALRCNVDAATAAVLILPVRLAVPAPLVVKVPWQVILVAVAAITNVAPAAIVTFPLIVN